MCLCQLCISIEIYFCSILKISATWSWKCCFTVCDGMKNKKSTCESVIQGYYGGGASFQLHPASPQLSWPTGGAYYCTPSLFSYLSYQLLYYRILVPYLHRPFNYSATEPGSSVIFIHFYTRDSIKWRYSFYHYCAHSKILQNVAKYRLIEILFQNS